MGRVVLRPAAERFVSRQPGVETRHCFSFGAHYDPVHVAHGRLVLHDEHRLEPGAGFAPHPHRDVDVVSWVLEGTLVHEHDGVLTRVPAGGLQRMTAGTGVVHAEHAADEGARFVQLWLTAAAGAVPSYEQVVAGELAEVLPGIWAGHLAGRWTLPAVPLAHVYVASGGCTLAGTTLSAGDSARLTGTGLQELTGDAEVMIVALGE